MKEKAGGAQEQAGSLLAAYDMLIAARKRIKWARELKLKKGIEIKEETEEERRKKEEAKIRAEKEAAERYAKVMAAVNSIASKMDDPLYPPELITFISRHLDIIRKVISDKDGKPALDEIPAGAKPAFEAVRCYLCQGAVKPGLLVVECTCKRVFHDSCAARVGTCPKCSGGLAAGKGSRYMVVEQILSELENYLDEFDRTGELPAAISGSRVATPDKVGKEDREEKREENEEKAGKSEERKQPEKESRLEKTPVEDKVAAETAEEEIKESSIVPEREETSESRFAGTSGAERTHSSRFGLTNGLGFERKGASYSRMDGRKGRRTRYIRKKKQSKMSKAAYVLPILAVLILTTAVFMALFTFTSSSGKIVVDGNISDWEGIPVVVDAGLHDRLSLQTTPYVNISGVRAAYDSNFFYFLVEFNDKPFKGESQDDGVDSLFIFLDLDGKKDSGYFISSVGADVRIRLTGWEGEIRSVYIERFNTSRDAADWNSFDFLSSSVSASVGKKCVELGVPRTVIEYADSGKVNISEIRYSVVALNSAGISDYMDSPADFYGRSILIYTERAGASGGAGTTGDTILENALYLDFQMFLAGSACRINSLYFLLEGEITAFRDCILRIRSLESISGSSYDKQFTGRQDGGVLVFEGINTTAGAGSKFEINITAYLQPVYGKKAGIEFISIYGVDGSDKSIGKSFILPFSDSGGIRTAGYMSGPPQAIEIDGLFKDWYEIERKADRNPDYEGSENPLPGRLNILSTKSFANHSLAAFYVEVEDMAVLSGADIPFIQTRLPSGGEGVLSGNLSPLNRLDWIIIYVQSSPDPAPGTFLEIKAGASEHLKADRRLVFGGHNGRVIVSLMEVFQSGYGGGGGSGWLAVESSTLKAAASGREFEAGISSLELGINISSGGGGASYIAFTTGWDINRNVSDSTAVESLLNHGSSGGRTDHAPISVESDQELLDLALTEGWTGDGTPLDPIIIPGLDITADPAGFGIKMFNIRLYFVVKDCSINVAYYGVYLQNTHNGVFINCSVTGAYKYGFYFETCRYIKVLNCTSTDPNGASGGVLLYQSDYCEAVGGSYSKYTEFGIGLLNSFDNNISGVRIFENSLNGLYLSGCEYNRIDNCSILNHDFGIKLANTRFTDIQYNTISHNNVVGISFEDDSNNNVVWHNYFADNGPSSSDHYKTPAGNILNLSYIYGGNYYAGVTGTNSRHGPNPGGGQTLEGCDGFLDTEIIFDGVPDFYPMTEWRKAPKVWTPIRINKDDEFTSANGVSGGTGNPINPYIIEDMDINGTGWGYCFYIGNTSKYYTIRNCSFHNASGNPNVWARNTIGYLRNSINGNIINCAMFFSQNEALYLYQASNISLVGLNISNITTTGINTSSSNNITIVSSFINTSYDGIIFQNVQWSMIMEIGIVNSSRNGLLISGSSNIEVVAVQTFGSYYGIRVESSSNMALSAIATSSSYDGYDILSSTNISLYNSSDAGSHCGAYVYLSSRVNMTGIELTAEDYGLVVEETNNSTFENLYIHSISEDGLTVYSVYNSTYSFTIYSCGGYGSLFILSGYSTLKDCRIEATVNTGLDFEDCKNITADGLFINECNPLIYMWGSSKIIISNSVAGNSNSGIGAEGSNNITFERVNASGITNEAFWTWRSENVSYYNCTVTLSMAAIGLYESKYIGIFNCTSNYTTSYGFITSYCENVNYTQCSASFASNNGLVIWYSNNTRVENCCFINNNLSGIGAQNFSDISIRNSTFNSNKDWGVFAQWGYNIKTEGCIFTGSSDMVHALGYYDLKGAGLAYCSFSNFSSFGSVFWNVSDAGTYANIYDNRLTLNSGQGVGHLAYLVQNSTLENDTFFNYDIGVLVELTQNLTVKKVSAYNCTTYGFFVRYDSKYNRFFNCSASGSWDGFYFLSSAYNFVENCSASGNQWAGIYLEKCNNTTLIYNNCSLNNYGIDIESSQNNIIRNNTLWRNNDYGIIVWNAGSTGNEIVWNIFLENRGSGTIYNPSNVQAYDENSGNRWNSSYPGYGNYWLDWDEPDLHNGSVQPQVSGGPDGIVDDSYKIDGPANAVDMYPIAIPELRDIWLIFIVAGAGLILLVERRGRHLKPKILP
ncbi:MAG: right-handed parallel beta-helix repeat-containing protein [Thermoplasmata archaeon]